MSYFHIEKATLVLEVTLFSSDMDVDNACHLLAFVLGPKKIV
uniref:Uncharacterized protein n=1 Tax=Rhizophora mucronata TaxID=61149 RepID=A0A2P2QB82_RHIMU